MKPWLLVLAVALSTLTARAQDLTQFYEDSESTLYVVRGGLVRGERGRIWVIADHKAARRGARSSRTLYEMNCSEQQFRIAQTTDFSGPRATGDVLGTVSGGWEYVPPGSVVATLMAAVCR